jgi:RNA polymerase sigma factor (sigma-70 family)
MTARALSPLLHYVRHLHGPAEGPDCGDGRLLERFARRGEEAAFEALLRRHGPMVLGVCRRLLRDAHAAEDAFQATFLLLLRKAGALRRPESLGPWLHGVARRTALRARAHAARRRPLPTQAEALAAPAGPDELVWRDLRPLLDEAVAALPAKYRAAFVLCCLEGLTHAEAARRLGCPPGTLAARLSRARARLRTRLTRQGVSLSAGVLAAVLAGDAARAALPPGLLGATCRAAAAFRAGGPAAAGVIPTRITALSEGVLRSMFTDTTRKLLGVLAAAGVAAAGAGALAFRAPAGEPPPAPERPVVVPTDVPPLAPPTAPARPSEPTKPTVTYRSTNFRVEAPSARVAQLVGQYAEHHRKAEALRWLGKELPPWPGPCPLRVTVTLSGAGGATSFAFDKGKVLSRDMHVQGSLEQILASVVPHEVTHTVLADHFRAPVPRWADEGIAILAEDAQAFERHDKLARQILLEAPGRAIPLRRLFPMQDFPRDVMPLYAEGFSVTRFLVGRKDNKTFLAFVKQGMKDGWDKAAEAHYGFADVEALEDAWLARLRAWRDEKETAALPRPSAPEAPRPPEREPPPIGPMPVTALAVVGQKGRLRVQMPVPDYVARTSYVFEEGGKVARPVTTYALEIRLQWREYDAAKVKAFDTAGHAVAPEKVKKWLAKELPVLVSVDGKEVAPFYLRVIEPGALVLVVSEPGVAPQAVGGPAPLLAPLAPPEK